MHLVPIAYLSTGHTSFLWGGEAVKNGVGGCAHPHFTATQGA